MNGRTKRISRTPHVVDLIVASNLRQIRKSRGETQVTLSRLLGVTPQQFHKYERGTNRISGPHLEALANALDVPVAMFFDGIGSTLSPSQNDAEVLRALQLFKSIPPEKRGEALKVLATFAEG